jgi:hypothetical protein
MRIVFDATTLHQSKGGSITAGVYFDFGGAQEFPVRGWDDFVVVIAGWWLSALTQVGRGMGETGLRFMDGPYWVAVRVQDDTRLLLRCIEDRKGAGQLFAAEVGAKDLTREVRSFARDVARACADAGFDSPDLSALARRLPN